MQFDKAQLARLENIASIQAYTRSHRKLLHGQEHKRLLHDIMVGIAAQVTVAIDFEIPFKLTTISANLGGVVVRATDRVNGQLIGHENDFDHKVYVLVYVDRETFETTPKGWAWGWELKAAGICDRLGTGRDCSAIPQENLNEYFDLTLDLSTGMIRPRHDGKRVGGPQRKLGEYGTK